MSEMKYKLSLLCIIKNEEYLEEFIIYHRLLGVEHFYIYDNESSFPVNERLKHYYYHKCCSIIHFPGSVKQMDAYNHCIQHYGKETDWLLIIDGDEFVLPKKHNNLIDFINEYNDYSAVALNWINFGSGYHQFKQKGYLIENYTYCQKEPDGHVKSFCRPCDVKKIYNPHFVILKDKNELKYKGYVDPLKNKLIFDNVNYYNNKTANESIGVIQVNHYWGRSYQEFEQKINRGRAMMGNKRDMPPNYHDIYHFKEDKLIINKYLNELKRTFDAICAHPNMYKILNKKLEKHLGDNLDAYTRHLIDFELKEKRPFKIEHVIPDFNLENYRLNYKDLSNLTCMQLIDHYVNYGKAEGRIYNKLIK